MMKIKIPGTKSFANRALLLASLTRGKSILKNMPEGEDVNLMIQAIKQLGANSRPATRRSRSGHRLQKRLKSALIIQGVGGKIKLKKTTFYTGNAGTVTRFLTAVLCFADKESIIEVSPEMEKRPIADLVDALRQLGAEIIYIKNEGFPPLKIRPIKLSNTHIELDASTSSQFLSAIMIAARLSPKKIHIKIKGLSSKPYVKMTSALIKKFKNKGTTLEIESDCVAASYFAGLSLIHHQKVEFNIPKNTIQGENEFFKKLPQLKKGNNRTINCNAFPDSAMTLAVLSAITPGTTKLTNIGHLRAKETDRLQALENELRKLNIQVKSTKNALTIKGNPKLQINSPILINTYNDHRMAMCFAMLKSKFPFIEIENLKCVQKSYPKFWEDYKKFILQTKNIVLTGMRGSGKTTIGKKLAKQLKCKFVDLDEILEKEFHTSISEFIEKNGWSKFRTKEKNMIKKLSQKKGLVIATGGGAIIDPKNEKMFKKNGIIVFLECPLEILQQRIEKDPKTSKNRPPLKNLKTLYEERKKRYYESADLIIYSKNENENTILERLFPTI